MNVTLTFSSPDMADIVALHIYESVAALGPWNMIERTTAIGTYPGYITAYTTANATSESDWFAIAWEDSNGNVGAMSAGVLGGTQSLVGVVVARVLQRDRFLDPNVVRQEAEAAVESQFRTDPYTVSADQSYRTINGLVYLTMARSYISASASSERSVQSATLGLVSFRDESGNDRKVDVQALIDLANETLGISTSLVFQREDVLSCLGYTNILEP
jgi:hypothetical protein